MLYHIFLNALTLQLKNVHFQQKNTLDFFYSNCVRFSFYIFFLEIVPIILEYGI